jgi:hypothetical protein
MAVGKKITRRKAGSGPSVNYFTSETQSAIVDFINEADIEKRKKIYTESIKQAFETLVENLINVYGFHVSLESKQDLKNHCVSELYEIIGKFKPERGSKAFSYFNVVAKRWLIMRAIKSVKMSQNFLSIDNKDSLSNYEMEIIENYSVIPSADEIRTQEQYRNEIKELLEAITEKVKTENEKTTIKAVELIFNSLDDLDFSNKRAIMNYLREITRLSPKKLSVALSSLKKHYKMAKVEEEV